MPRLNNYTSPNDQFNHSRRTGSSGKQWSYSSRNNLKFLFLPIELQRGENSTINVRDFYDTNSRPIHIQDPTFDDSTNQSSRESTKRHLNQERYSQNGNIANELRSNQVHAGTEYFPGRKTPLHSSRYESHTNEGRDQGVSRDRSRLKISTAYHGDGDSVLKSDREHPLSLGSLGSPSSGLDALNQQHNAR